MFNIHQLLIFAARAGNVSLVQARIAAGGNPRYFDTRYGSALLAAIQGHHAPVVDYLLLQGADLQTVNERGQGALEYALYWQDDEIVVLLLRWNARLQPHALPNFKRALSDCMQRQAKP